MTGAAKRMSKHFSKSTPLILLFGTAIILYCSVKASLASFTHDESFSYLNYIHTGFMDILSFKNWYTNNHILNSLFMKYSEVLFGTSEIALRLPNLILFVVFLTYSFLLFRKTDPTIQIGIFLLLCTNPSITDFFALARGYGLSFGFMFMSLYHFIRYFDKRQTKHILLFHAGALLAVLSSFPLLHFYIMLLVIYNAMDLIECKIVSPKKYNFLSSNKVNMLPLLLVAMLLFEPIRRVLTNSQLDFGGKNGFYNDTVTSLIKIALHDLELSSTALTAVQVLFTGIIVIPFFGILRMLLKKNADFFVRHKGLVISNLLLIFIAVAIILQHIILKADYPIARFSLFMLLLFIVHLGFFLGYISLFYRRGVSIFVLALAVVPLFGFVRNADLYSCSEWGYERDTKNMILKLTEYHGNSSTDMDTVTLGTHWLFEPTINFYRHTRKLDWLSAPDRNGITADDYYYMFNEDWKKMAPEKYQLIAEFPLSNTVLLKSCPNCPVTKSILHPD